MDGSNTLVCDGNNWNGSVPDCNGKLLFLHVQRVFNQVIIIIKLNPMSLSLR